MTDVAELAGVSLKTVSRVVNAEPGVNAATTARVAAAIRTLGFRANQAAAHLARRTRPASVGLVIEDMGDPFYARLASGVEQIARERGHALLICSSGEDASLERTVTLGLAARAVAGLVIVPCSPDQGYLADEIAAGLAVVFADRPPRGLSADCVLADNSSASAHGTTHLLSVGHRRVAFVGNATSVYTSSQRLAGFRAAHAEAHLEVDERLVVLGPTDSASAYRAVAALLSASDPPTAVFTQNNLLTLGAWRAAHEHADPPALLGFDDFELADLLQPAVSVIAQDPLTLGRTAALMLFDRLTNRHGPGRQVVLPTKLLLR